jgi:predicted secreted hydrolase
VAGTGGVLALTAIALGALGRTPAAPAAAAAPATPAAAATAATPAASTAPAQSAAFASVVPDRPLVFPADYGSHPEYRTEWWYITGWLKTRGGESLGFQVTFFRARPELKGDNPSAFTPRQLIIAHAAISDPRRGRLWQDQRIERAGFGLADARVGDTDVWVGPWRLERAADRTYTAHVAGEEFSFDLDFKETQALLLNGIHGVSRKGPSPQSASYYYSLPHLAVAGSITRAGRSDEVTGEAWFDHEWSSEYLDPEAVGWDWIGIDLDDGGALMAFEIRGAHGEPRWTGGSLRSAGGQVQILTGAEVQFLPQRHWRSPRTGIDYPVQWLVTAGGRRFELQPLLDDQENDTRLSTGAIYWEGAVRAFEGPRAVGRGYLELTGYGDKLELR